MSTACIWIYSEGLASSGEHRALGLLAVSSLRCINVIVCPEQCEVECIDDPLQSSACYPLHIFASFRFVFQTRRDMPELEKYLGEVYLWKYVPSFPAAIAFAILFLVLTIVHGWVMWRTRLWFCLPFFIGGICESRSRAY